MNPFFVDYEIKVEKNDNKVIMKKENIPKCECEGVAPTEVRPNVLLHQDSEWNAKRSDV